MDGKVIDRGSGCDVLGHPFHAVAWLATHLARMGTALRAGDIVMTGNTVTTKFPDRPAAYRFELMASVRSIFRSAFSAFSRNIRGWRAGQNGPWIAKQARARDWRIAGAGKVIAAALRNEGAAVAICSRDPRELRPQRRTSAPQGSRPTCRLPARRTMCCGR